jgi:NTP pyrophosphatase (non-canonical NTP hydrolase)
MAKKKTTKSAKKTLTEIMTVGSRSIRGDSSYILSYFMQEAGELSEAAQIRAGEILHKKLKHREQVYEEAADSIICILDLVRAAYAKDLKQGKIDHDKLMGKVLEWIPRKLRKWEKTSLKK